MSMERSTLSTGFTLSCTTVSVTLLSNWCVAATKMWRLACSTGNPPDLVRASKVESGVLLLLLVIAVQRPRGEVRQEFLLLPLAPHVSRLDDRGSQAVVLVQPLEASVQLLGNLGVVSLHCDCTNATGGLSA